MTTPTEARDRKGSDIYRRRPVNKSLGVVYLVIDGVTHLIGIQILLSVVITITLSK